MMKRSKYAQQEKSPIGDLGVLVAQMADFEDILDIQKKAFYSEAEFYHNFNIQPLTQTLSEMEEECRGKVVLKAMINGKIVGSIRANVHETGCWVNKLVVLPEFQRQGIGEKLLREIETYFPDAEKFTLGTGAYSESNIRLYEKVGYKIIGHETFHDGIEAVLMEKSIHHHFSESNQQKE
jgi:ribosomal protein S18 acetylase RimI-like enzyme